MVVRRTEAGSPVVEMIAEEYGAYLESEVGRASGRSVAEFGRACDRGELDDADPSVSELAGLLRVGQSGHASS